MTIRPLRDRKWEKHTEGLRNVWVEGGGGGRREVEEGGGGGREVEEGGGGGRGVEGGGGGGWRRGVEVFEFLSKQIN